jgi:lipopolysaccharide/colanic/teichoic acid biosynthesis glycosyltransferase
LDVLGALGLLLVTLPLLILMTGLVRLAVGETVLVWHRRMGRRGQYFLHYRFATMPAARDSRGAHGPRRQKVTPFGRFMVRTGLDRMPQLCNVLVGDMSFFGDDRGVQDTPVQHNRQRTLSLVQSSRN